jgi:ABC-type branched-subunit amino acid transport system substrate-binding protein
MPSVALPARSAVGFLVVLAAALAARPADSLPAAPPSPTVTWKAAFIGPLSGPLAASGKESLEGVKLALSLHASQFGAKPPELLELDDGDDVKKADAAIAKAQQAKVDVVFAAATGVTVDALVAKARTKTGPLLLLVGSASHVPSPLAEDPVASLVPWPADHATSVIDFLEIPCQSKQPALVVEDTPRGRQFEAAIVRSLPVRMQIAGTLFVKPHAAPAKDALAAAQAAKADRLIVFGEPDLVDGVADALAALSWKVPLFLDDGLVSAAATSLHDGRASDGFALVALPRFCMKAPDALTAAWQAKHPGADVPLRTLKAYAMAKAFADVVVQFPKHAKREELNEALRLLPYGDEESGRPLFDMTGRSARTLWLPRKLAATGTEADEASRYLDPDFGPLLRARPPSLYKAEPGSRVVWLTFGDAKSKAPRSIEDDLVKLGLITKGYEAQMDEWILDELLARAMAKLNRLFLKNEDGTFIPGVSFNISFTTEKPKDLKPGEYFTAVIAGNDPESGGRAWPGEGRCEIYSTFMQRTIFQKNALTPPLKSEDRRYFTGAYLWGTDSTENLRSKTIRSLLDGYAGSFALTGAHEIGHLCGLGHDTDDPRSLMNVVEGAGLRETSVCWIPAHVKTLEKFLGRYEPPKEKRRP